MEKEIDLRALIVDNLVYNYHDIPPYSFNTPNGTNIVDRPFDTNKKWTKVEQTSYIESIFLHCSLQPIIRFVNYNRTVIVDGYNRYLAIKDFCNNKLKLDIRGLKQLKFLANKKYSNLTEKELQYFKKCDPIRVLDYSYNNKNNNRTILTLEEEIEIERYIHVIYNTILRLELEEIQKAQFLNDYLTNKIKEDINNTQNNFNENFLTKLESLKLYNGRKKRNKIDNILLNCRLLIASTYSNINTFTQTNNLETRIEENYLPNLQNENLDNIYQDFTLNIKQIHNNLISTQKWLSYPILHTKPFLDATYWLISVIRKDNLSDPFKFDFIKYLEYFGNLEEKENNFNPYQAHYKKNLFNKYFVVAKYYEKVYGINMDKYFKEEDNQKKLKTITNIEELHQKNQNSIPIKIKIRDLLTELKTVNYNLKPIYQREEIMNTALASKIIESILLGIIIPNILVCDKYKDGKFITEVVDGQQRILSILGFLEEPYMTKEGNLEYSNKNSYALKDLRILHECNNLKFNSDNPNQKLSQDKINKILDTDIHIYKTIENENNHFNAIDHFVRLNKNICTIKENTYAMWNLTTDKKIIDYEQNITKKFKGTILPKTNQKRTANMVTLKLACLFYHNDYKEIIFNNYSSSRVSCWLKEFTKYKDKNINKFPEKIAILRKLYLKSLDEVNDFYLKIDNFINSLDKSIEDLINLTNYATIPLSTYYYLFCLLATIPQPDLIDNNQTIYNIINNFFIKIKSTKLNNKDLAELLNFNLQQITVFDNSKRY